MNTRRSKLPRRGEHKSSSPPVYPFSAIVGQDEMKLALILNVIDSSIGGVLIMGHRGTGKSTAVRALADLLPEVWIVRNCPYHCDPGNENDLCAGCKKLLDSESRLPREHLPVPVVDLPLGATEDRVCGMIDIERALREGVKAFEPGLLARANRGFLYIDEVNLLEDHLVDLLLDVAVTGHNRVERESISVEHPARFVLIGSGNPEEGELRPQLLDRFGLHVEVKTENDLDQRVDIVEKREAFELDPEGFRAQLAGLQARLRRQITRARKNFASVKVPRGLLRRIAALCSELKIDGHRGELTMTRAARALAAFEGRKLVIEPDVLRVALMSLRHRLRRDPLDDTGGGARAEQAIDKLFPQQRRQKISTRQGSAQGNRLPHIEGGPAEKGQETNRRGARGPRGEDGSDLRFEQPAPPAVDSALPQFAFRHPVKRKGQSLRTGRKKPGRSSYNLERGRYSRASPTRRAGAKIAVDATLRSAVKVRLGGGVTRGAGEVGDERNPLTRFKVGANELRFKRFTRKNGTLFIFAVDASGSMALNRISQAKGALIRLLRRSYVNRDSVAIVGFRGTKAEVLLSPSRSTVRARRVLDSLTTGSGTPLSAGLACSLEVARRCVAQNSGETILLLFTDGQANVPLRPNGGGDRAVRQQLIQSEVEYLGSELRKAGVQSVVVDPHHSFVSKGKARALAESLAARYVQIELKSQ